jgi:formate hydrogenlyase subunit 3/multisubunit Na+/H+ antiporter MnhD subunit
MATVLLGVVVLVPFVAGAASHAFGAARAPQAVRTSLGAALVMVSAVTMAALDVTITLPLLGDRSLVLSPIAQLGIQLVALGMLGLVLSLEDESPALVSGWLTIAWVSVGGLTLALLVNALPLALLAFLSAALLWAIGETVVAPGTSSTVVMRYAALLALVLPLVLTAFRLAIERTATTPDAERLVLALLVPSFGLVLGLMPLHAWALTLASGTPRPMLFGVLTLVQTAGFALLLRTFASYSWMLGAAQGPLLVGGAVSTLVGGWLALAARLDDADDFLVYAVVANGGLLLAGLGARAEAAGSGVALMLSARVIALVLLALAPRAGGSLRRAAYAIGILTLAGMPGLAGFPGLWLILRRLQESSGAVAPLAILVGCFFLAATALRRWQVEDAPEPAGGARGARRAVWMLIAVLVVLGLAPQIITPAFSGSLRDIFFLVR